MDRTWPADRVERRAVDSLMPYAGNARTHSEEQVAQIAASIEEWGWTSPVLVDEDGSIIAGHGRVLAATRLGLTEVPVMVARGWSADQKRAYVIADNQLAMNAGWDADLLRVELGDLLGAGFNLDLIGFSDDGLAEILNPPSRSEADPDEEVEPPAVPVTLPGDVWLMGGHRIICGDSTSAETVAAVLAGAKPHLMVTDPPYGVEYDAGWRDGLDRPRTGGAKGFSAKGKVSNDDRADWVGAWALFPGDVAYVWCASMTNDAVIASLEAASLLRRSQIIWNKPHFAIGRGDYHWQHELCWYAVRKGQSGHWAGDRKQTTVWTITSGVGFTTKTKGADARTGHSTQKPVECMKRPIENNSKPGDAVYEPFSGSGTTIIAAEMTGRRCYAIELSPAYVDVAVLRWENFTGRVATLEATGQTFREIKDERHGREGPHAEANRAA